MLVDLLAVPPSHVTIRRLWAEEAARRSSHYQPVPMPPMWSRLVSATEGKFCETLLGCVRPYLGLVEAAESLGPRPPLLWHMELHKTGLFQGGGWGRRIPLIDEAQAAAATAYVAAAASSSDAHDDAADAADSGGISDAAAPRGGPSKRLRRCTRFSPCTVLLECTRSARSPFDETSTPSPRRRRLPGSSVDAQAGRVRDVRAA